MSEIKVMMFGASRSGKTSILASMYNKRTEVTKYGFTLHDKTKIENEEQDTLLQSVLGMKNLLGTESRFLKMGALTGGKGVFHYSFELGYSNYKKIPPTTLTFIDVAGEFFNQTHEQFNTVCELVKDCQILVVAVDTPALLLAKEKGDYGWDNEINCTDALIDAVQYLGVNCREEDEGEPPLRMVIFVPIKSERWLHNERAEEYMQLIKKQIETVYGDSIAICENEDSRTKVMVMPLETIGGLEFDHHTPTERMRILKFAQNNHIDADKWEDIFLFSEKDENAHYASRCELDADDDNVVILAKTGRHYQLKDGDELVHVEELPVYPYCYRKNRPIPFAWFRSIGIYAPKNCEQLFFEIVKFMVQQVADEYDKNVNDLINQDIDKSFRKFLFEDILRRKGFYDDERQLQAMCRAIRQIKEENKLNKCFIIHNNIDYQGSELEIE